jgi:hypothetical protein
VFSVNQHVEVDLDFAWWSNSFKAADPIPLTRGWCLFEIYSIIVTGSQFEVAMTQASREAFLKDIVSDPGGAVNKTIDVAKSECFEQAHI